MANPTQQDPKKRSLGLMLVLGFLGLALFMAVGKALSYFGMLLGLVAIGGSGYALVKGPPERKKLAVIGIGVGVLLLLFGNMGASESRQRAAAESAGVEAAKKKAEQDKAGGEKLVAQLAALDASAAASQVAKLCMDITKLGEVPAAHATRCGDALLSEGRTALAAKRAGDAAALLERAAKLSSKKDEAAAALTDAKVVIAVEAATSELARANKAYDENQIAKSAKLAKEVAASVAAAQRLKPDDAALKELAAGAEALLVKADPAKRDAAEQAAFDAMSAPEHLAAAKAALAKSKISVAEKHLAALSPSEEKAAKPLLAEVELLKKRAAQDAKLAEVMESAAKDAKYEVVKGRLIITDTATNLGGQREDITVMGYLTLKFVAEKWADLPDITSITVIENSTFTDTRGNEKAIKVGEYTVSRARAKTINWSNIRSENILKAIDKAWVAPGVAITVD